MATDELLAYLIALSVPIWLLIEHAIAWLLSRSRSQHDNDIETAPSTRVAPDDPSKVSRKAA